MSSIEVASASCSLKKSLYGRLPCSASDALFLEASRSSRIYVDSQLFGGSLEGTLIISLSTMIFCIKMNMIADALRSLLEPLIWNALQWVWSLDATTETSALPLRFYSYSLTSFLLWIYEKLPHSWILFILAVGLCTILGVIIVISCYLGKVSSWILRVYFRYSCSLCIKILCNPLFSSSKGQLVCFSLSCEIYY